MQIARLEGFYWVARSGGYAAAARAFPYPLPQSAVFQQVRKLQDELGVRLFEQVGKAEVRLTAAGRQLYEHAAPFFERLPAVERALKSATPARELRLAAEALILQQVLPGWIRRLQRRAPAQFKVGQTGGEVAGSSSDREVPRRVPLNRDTAESKLRRGRAHCP